MKYQSLHKSDLLRSKSNPLLKLQVSKIGSSNKDLSSGPRSNTPKNVNQFNGKLQLNDEVLVSYSRQPTKQTSLQKIDQLFNRIRNQTEPANDQTPKPSTPQRKQPSSAKMQKSNSEFLQRIMQQSKDSSKVINSKNNSSSQEKTLKYFAINKGFQPPSTGSREQRPKKSLKLGSNSYHELQHSSLRDQSTRNLSKQSQHQEQPLSPSSQLLKKIYQETPKQQTSQRKFNISNSLLQNHQEQIIRYQKFLQAQLQNPNKTQETVEKKGSALLDQFVTNVKQNQDPLRSMAKAADKKAIVPNTKKMLSVPNDQGEKVYYVTSLVTSLYNDPRGDAILYIYREHLQQTFTALNFCSMLKNVDPVVLEAKRVNIKRQEKYQNMKTIVFDLDETLIHCNENQQAKSDVQIPIVFPTGDTVLAGINVRPFCFDILRELSLIAEVIVFTASHQCYASKVINHIDPKKEYISAMLFRDSCVVTEEGVHIKDLRVINRDLKDMVLVDNAAYSFGYQIDNGIPIIPYYDNKADVELRDLLGYIKKQILPAKDVRKVINQTFQLKRFNDFLNPQTAVEKIYNLKY